MSILAIHPGDLHLRAAFMGPLDAPASLEDAAEPARFVTPSIAVLDVGGALLGYPALMACATESGARVAWRYSRASLPDRAVVARDRDGAGVTSETFLALAAARFVADARGYTSAAPDLAFAVPQDLDAGTRTRVGRSIGQNTGRPVRLIGEDDALLAACDVAAGKWLVISLDDDAIRMRLVAGPAGELNSLGRLTVPGAGVPAVRARWVAAWNAQAGGLVPQAAGYDADSYEFERLWQELFEWLDSDGDGSRMLAWPLLRQSTVLTLCAHGPSLLQDLGDCITGIAERAGALCTESACVPDGLLVVGPAVLRRVLLPQLQARLSLGPEQCRQAGAEAYARGAAALAAGGAGAIVTEVSEAPHALGVVGLGEDGAASVRTLVQRGQSLPATAQFTIVADRDVQKEVTVTLTCSQSAADGVHRYAFGPLVGAGLQRIGVAVEWRRDGAIEARAIDRETGVPLACMDRIELSCGVPLVAVHRLRST